MHAYGSTTQQDMEREGADYLNSLENDEDLSLDMEETDEAGAETFRWF